MTNLDSQRKGLEKRFQQQKYISKPDRKKLAERLGLKDSQVSNSKLVDQQEFPNKNINKKICCNYKSQFKAHKITTSF